MLSKVVDVLAVWFLLAAFGALAFGAFIHAGEKINEKSSDLNESPATERSGSYSIGIRQ
jgi:hypothetical protein